jgi:4-amino-4-deoxy-L-arabinose transferase-like glycosyltransferase
MISLTLRIWLLDKRWIDPDEGAHMMDAVLVLDGKIPFVDFHSRQPFYTYMIAGAFKLVGVNYAFGRSLMLVFSMLVGLMIFFIARNIFDENMAFVSAALYFMLPLENLNSGMVKTEPLAMLIVCLAFYAVIKFIQGEQVLWLLIAGIFSALGFYVRQSALVVPVSVFFFLLIFYNGSLLEKLGRFSCFLIGYFIVIIVVMFSFAKFMGIASVLKSPLNPFAFIIKATKNMSYFLSSNINTNNALLSQNPIDIYTPHSLYVKYIRQAISMHLFLILGTGLLIFTLGYQAVSRKIKKTDTIPYSLFYLWIILLFSAYAYYFKARGFYIDYFREFIPPLVILFSAWLYTALAYLKNNQHEIRFVVIAGILSTGLFFLFFSFKGQIRTSTIILISLIGFSFFQYRKKIMEYNRQRLFIAILIALLSLMVIQAHTSMKISVPSNIMNIIILGVVLITPYALMWQKERFEIKNFASFISLALVLVAFISNLAYSANKLSLTYDANWSPQAVKKVASYINTHTQKKDEIISGAIIWELQAQRRPFKNISHPLGLEFQISEEWRKKLEADIIDNPPKIVVMDGVTEKTYLKQVPYLATIIKNNYDLVYTAEQARKPIEIFLEQ